MRFSCVRSCGRSVVLTNVSNWRGLEVRYAERAGDVGNEGSEVAGSEALTAKESDILFEN